MIDSSPNCKDCQHYRETTLFELCKSPESTYTAGGKTDQHTVGHMRRLGCGPEARLFDPRALTSSDPVRN